MMKKTVWITLLLTALFVSACAAANPAPTEPAESTFISVDELVAMLDSRRESFVLVNTHIPFEGDIPTTDFSAPYNDLEAYLGQFPADKDAEIVLYCMSDRMARIAADELIESGYANLKILSGGMIAWGSAGQPLDMEQ